MPSRKVDMDALTWSPCPPVTAGNHDRTGAAPVPAKELHGDGRRVDRTEGFYGRARGTGGGRPRKAAGGSSSGRAEDLAGARDDFKSP